MTTETATTKLRPSQLSKAMSTHPRPRRPSVLSATLTFAWRALLKIRHVPEQLFDVTAFPVIFTLMFTYLFGGALAGSTNEYLHYLLPGILVLTVMMTTMYTGMTLNTDISTGVFNRFRSLPVWPPTALLGALIGDTVRFTTASGVVLALGLTLGFRPSGGTLGSLAAVLLVVLFALSATWIWISLSLILRTPNSVMSVSMMVMFPLTFTSNVFVRPETMPGWLTTFVKVNPITHLTTAVRGLMDGWATAGQVGLVLLSCVVLFAVFAPITMRLYSTKN